MDNSANMGPYRLVRLLGRGAMGVVHLAHEDSLNRDVALKILSADLASDSSFVERFCREAQSAAGLRHPNIVQIYALSESGQVPYFAMEYVEGEDLKTTLSGSRGLSWRTGLDIINQVAKALDVAHSKGVVHRDIKPGNVMVEKGSGRIVVTDFGLSRVMAGSRLTRDGEVFGTPEYMSPEQIEGKEIDGRADLYALGVMLFELLTGTVPFEAESALAVMRKHADVPPPLACDINPEVPEEVAHLCDRLLEKKPEDRYQTAGELVHAIDRLLMAKSETVLTLGEKRRPKRRTHQPVLGTRVVWLFMGGMLVLAGLTVGALLATRLKPAKPYKGEEDLSFKKAYASAETLAKKGKWADALTKYWAIATLCEEDQSREKALSGAKDCLVTLVNEGQVTFPQILTESGLFSNTELATVLDKAREGDMIGAVRAAMGILVEKGLLSEDEARQLIEDKKVEFPQKWKQRYPLFSRRVEKSRETKASKKQEGSDDGS